jgi:cell division control protein 6
MPQYFSVFKNESKLDINYVPPRLPHRGPQLNLLNQFFRFAIERPGKMTQRVLILGTIGTGKTVLSQHFGLNVIKEAEKRNINLNYVHVNCRECKGSLFMILQRTILSFYPHFPKRGYSAEELLQALMQILDEENAYLILALDELEALILSEGSDPLYNLTRIQEERLKAPQRLSLICILRQPEHLDKLDASTRSTLQRNVIHLKEYSKPQLEDILNDRVNLAFKQGTVSAQTMNLAAELAYSEEGNARYAIELLWRAGKYADASEMQEVSPECVRKAAIARHFKYTDTAYMSMGEAEDAYAIVCEEYDENIRGHTQLWKYVKTLSASGVIETKVSGERQRGKTTLISLPRVPASDLEKELSRIIKQRGR